ncbi:MAG: molybdenum cofactor biosynthesis protein MoaE [Phycisphaerae bacterium]
MIRVNVVFFGPARDLAGADSASLELNDGAKVADLRGTLSQTYPGLRAALPAIRLAINEAFVDDEVALQNNVDVALIPPVSGGGGDEHIMVELVREAIPAERIRRFVTGDPASGAIVTFEGATRSEAHARHGALARLDYEAYGEMARSRLMLLAQEAKEQWRLGRVAIMHRIGPVGIAEASVTIAVAGGHRAECFDACRWLIDQLKQDVPIWKKEVYEDGHTAWVVPRSLIHALPSATSEYS